MHIRLLKHNVHICMYKHFMQQLSRGLRRKTKGIGPPARGILSPRTTQGIHREKKAVLRQAKVLYKDVYLCTYMIRYLNLHAFGDL